LRELLQFPETFFFHHSQALPIRCGLFPEEKFATAIFPLQSLPQAHGWNTKVISAHHPGGMESRESFAAESAVYSEQQAARHSMGI
jgi:hypothetical protein